MKNTETQRPASLAAAHGSDARLTMATMMALLSTLPPPPKWHACTAKPEHVARLRTECQAASPSQICDTLAGIRLYEKPGQVADAWMFSDDKILRKYLNGELTELDLFFIMPSLRCSSARSAKPLGYPAGDGALESGDDDGLPARGGHECA